VDAGLEVKACGLAFRIFDVRIGDRLQIREAKHIDIGPQQTTIWYSTVNPLESQYLIGEIEFQEVICSWRIAWSPDDVKAFSSPRAW
jgi:hypothetical protein